jgi:hypothetical protein
MHVSLSLYIDFILLHLIQKSRIPLSIWQYFLVQQSLVTQQNHLFDPNWIKNEEFCKLIFINDLPFYHPLKLWKENSDGQQFHQYQNHLSLRTRQWHMVLEIQVLAWDRHKNMAGLNQLMGSNLTTPFRKHAKYISLYLFLRRQHFRQFK